MTDEKTWRGVNVVLSEEELAFLSRASEGRWGRPNRAGLLRLLVRWEMERAQKEEAAV